MKQLLVILAAVTMISTLSCSRKDEAKPQAKSLKNTEWVSDDQSMHLVFNADNTGKINDQDGALFYTFTYFEGDEHDGNTDYSLTLKDSDSGAILSLTGYYNDDILVLNLATNTYSFTKVK